jgi:hypothetical protein
MFLRSDTRSAIRILAIHPIQTISPGVLVWALIEKIASGMVETGEKREIMAMRSG